MIYWRLSNGSLATLHFFAEPTDSPMIDSLAGEWRLATGDSPFLLRRLTRLAVVGYLIH